MSKPFSPFNPVVVAPTYNNARTLPALIAGVASLGLPLIVVDDGSTDATASVLDACTPAIRVTHVRHARNRGKAAALRTGFCEAAKAGYTHAVTIDTDGQHDPAEIPKLLACAREAPEAMVLGLRDEAAPGYPGKSKLGRRVSNLFIRMESGVCVEDSQCGLRVYPLGLVAAVRCRAGRFGFETEIVTRAGWAGCPVVETPVACRYLPPGERVSHLNPLLDTLRAVAMHARLLTRALLPWPSHARWPGRDAGDATTAVHEPEDGAIPAPGERGAATWVGDAKPARSAEDHAKPARDAKDAAKPARSAEDNAKAARSAEGGAKAAGVVRRLLDWLNPAEAWRQARRDRVGRESFAAALAVGAFIGNLPAYGLHTLIGLYAARRLHLQPLAVVVGTHVSTPPVGPVLNAAAIVLGHLILHGSMPSRFNYDIRNLGFLEVLRRMLLEWFIGSPVVGLACAVLVFALSNRAIRLAAAKAPVGAKPATDVDQV